MTEQNSQAPAQNTNKLAKAAFEKKLKELQKKLFREGHQPKYNSRVIRTSSFGHRVK